MTDIILVSSEADEARITAIADALRGAGLTLWRSAEAPAGAARRAAVAEQVATAKLCLVAWTETSAHSDRGSDVIELAEIGTGQGKYVGLLLDKVDLPFGFGGHQAIEVAPFRGAGDAKLGALVEQVKAVALTGPTVVAQLAPPPPPPPDRSGLYKIVGAAVAVVVVAAIVLFVFMRMSAPSVGDLVEAKLSAVPCAWLRIDPVQDGSSGTLGLTGVAGDPGAAREAVLTLVRDNKLPITDVSNAKVAQIDGRECPAIEEPRRLRKSPGGRLLVTGEPFILDDSLPKAQALARVQIRLAPGDKTMALFGVEPSGVVTWALPDIETLEGLKNADIGYVKSEDGHWEFNIYPDHLGWTGLFVVTGDQPLAKKLPPLTVQRSREFAQTLREATAKGDWDADMVWFRIDPR